MDVKLDKWFRPNIEKEVLKQLSEKSDFKGLLHVSIYFGILFLFGLLAYYTWGTWWSIFWFYVYGNIYCFCNPIWHETGHKTAFKTKFLNELFYYIACFMAYFEPTRWRFTHFVHHGNTYSTKDPYDHEIEYDNNLKDTPRKLFMNLVPFGELLFFKKSIAYEIIKHALGLISNVVKITVPKKEINKVVFMSRIYVSLWLLIIGISLLLNSWLPIIMIILPPFYGNTILMICGMTQHAGLADNVKDHRKSTRTVILNPFFSFLYSNMEYHIEHHIFPKIPCHNLKKFHKKIKDQMPTPKRGVIDAYKSIIPAIFKQAKDKNYFIDVEIPTTN